MSVAQYYERPRTLDNTVTVCGSTVRDPELRFTPNGQAVASFSVAVNRRWQNKQTKEWEESVSFIDVVAWAGLAENVAESIVKGTRVIINGRMEQRSWETSDGDKRSKIEIVADEVGVSLRWATAQATKNERRGPGDAREAVAAHTPAATYDQAYKEHPQYDEAPF